ncbi:MAG: TlpA disulfide reductase family protein [Parvularculales bacterium]
MITQRWILALVGIGLVVAFLGVWLMQSPSDRQEESKGNAGNLGSYAHGAMANFVPVEEDVKPAVAPFVGGDGETLTLADFKGQVVLVNLWATWCAPCREEMPSLDRLQQHLDSEDFSVVAIASDRGGVEAARTFLAEIDANTLGVYVDSTARIGPALGSFGLPASLLLGRDGRELGRLAGPAEWDSDEAIALIRAALALR